MTVVLQFLAFDWGKLRIGVASGNTLMRRAQGVTTLTEQGAALDLVIQKLVKEWHPSALICGVPYHPDGAPHRNTKLAKQFAQHLGKLTGLEVIEIDERYSTTEAKLDNPISTKRSAKQVEAKLDSLSACIILEQYMRSLPE